MIIEYSAQFQRMIGRAPREIRILFAGMIGDFREDPVAGHFRTHALRGKFAGMHSVNVTDDYRAIFSWNERINTITFLLSGTHKELYG